MFNSGNEYIIVQSEIKIENLKQGTLQLFNYRKIATSTSNFDEANKLGQGNLGPVYKVFLVPEDLSSLES